MKNDTENDEMNKESEGKKNDKNERKTVKPRKDGSVMKRK